MMTANFIRTATENDAMVDAYCQSLGEARQVSLSMPMIFVTDLMGEDC